MIGADSHMSLSVVLHISRKDGNLACMIKPRTHGEIFLGKFFLAVLDVETRPQSTHTKFSVFGFVGKLARQLSGE